MLDSRGFYYEMVSLAAGVPFEGRLSLYETWSRCLFGQVQLADTSVC